MVKQHKQSYWLPLSILLLTQLLTALPLKLGSLLSIVWFTWIAICSYFVFLFLSGKKSLRNNLFAKLILLFWLMNAISYLISPKTINSIETLVLFKSTTIALLSYFPFYYYSSKGIINQNNLQRFTLFLFLTTVLINVFGRFNLAELYSKDDVVLNQSYLFVNLLPLIFILFRRGPLYLLVTITVLLVLWGAKRGAILCMVVELMVFIFYLFKYDSFGKKHRGKILILFMMMIGVGAYYIERNDFLQERLTKTGTEDDRSGEIRTEMYKSLFEAYLLSSTSNEIVFGRGIGQTVSITGSLAHQDWLELLIDNGFVGLVLYIFMIILCINKSFKRETPLVLRYGLRGCIIIWILTATYSMVFASRESFVFFISVGVIDGLIQRCRINQRMEAYNEVKLLEI